MIRRCKFVAAAKNSLWPGSRKRVRRGLLRATVTNLLTIDSSSRELRYLVLARPRQLIYDETRR